MIKILPFVLIPLFLIGGLTYFRFVYLPSKNLESPKSLAQQIGPIEVPKSLPGATNEDKINTLEKSIASLVKEINSLKSFSSPQTGSIDTDSISSLEGSIVELKARVSALEKATPAPVATASKSTVYIPLGSGGGPWTDQNWYSTSEYQISLDPANYPGYTGMYLEVTFRLSEPVGTASVRLYNSTDSSAISSQVDTKSTSFVLGTSSSFKLVSGSKNYTIQVKNTDGKNLFVQTARIRVSF